MSRGPGKLERSSSTHCNGVFDFELEAAGERCREVEEGIVPFGNDGDKPAFNCVTV